MLRFVSTFLVLVAFQSRVISATGIGSTSSSSTPPPQKAEPIDPNSLKRKRVNEDSNSSTEATKKCTICEEFLPSSEFNKDKRAKDGLQFRCRDCQKTTRLKCEECDKIPNFGFVQRKATHCGEHKKRGMSNVKSKKCALCDKRPSFGLEIGRPLYCKKHKKHGMSNVADPKCASCNKQPSYGLEIGKPVYCKEHKTNEMYEVKNAKCKYEGGCPVRPTFGIERAEFCAAHKADDMVNIKSKQCNGLNCSRPAMYARPGQKREKCSTHATQGMVHVVRKNCSDCETCASYGTPGFSKTKCVQHKLTGMLYLRYTRCVENGCTNPCTHGVGVAKWCEVHALPTHNNLVERECSDCGLVQILNADNKCEFCDTQLDEPAKVHLRKQKEIQAFLDSDPELADYDFTDRQLKYEGDIKCATAYRPDFVWDMGTHIAGQLSFLLEYMYGTRLMTYLSLCVSCVAVLENDEFKHRGSSYQCEELRMRQIAEDMMRPAVFIRFNCDGFKVNGVAQKVGPTERYTELKKWVFHCKDVSNLVGVVSAVHLYYDDFKASETEVKVLVENFS